MRPPSNVDCVTLPLSNVDCCWSRPVADELVILKLFATTSSIVPWNSVLEITEFVITLWSIVVLVKMLLLPVPSEKSESTISALLISTVSNEP